MQRALCILPILSHRIFKKTCTQNLMFNKINSFYCFIKNILKKKLALVLLQVYAMFTAESGVIVLIHTQIQQFHPHYFCIISSNCQHSERAKNALILLSKYFFAPEKTLRISRSLKTTF